MNLIIELTEEQTDSLLEIVPLDRFLSQYDYDEVLSYYDDNAVIRYVEDDLDKVVFEDYYDAKQCLSDNDYLDDEWPDGIPDFRKEDCKSLITNIVEKQGWDYLYNLLEGQKNILNLT